MRYLLALLLIPTLTWGAIDGLDDTLYLSGLSVGPVAPNRTIVAGYVRNDSMATSDGRTAQRGRGQTSPATSFGGPHVSTTVGNNDWTTTDFEGDIYWWPDVYDTLLKCCVGNAASDTQYISAVFLEFTLATKTALIDSLRGKIQGPVLQRPRPPGVVTGSGRTFGTTGVDSSPCFNWFALNRPAASDTIFWRDSTVSGAPGVYDSNSALGDEAGDYELTITSGGNYTTKIDVGIASQGALTGHIAPVIWSPVGVAQGARVTGVDITAIFKAGLLASANNPATMRTEGFGILIDWVYFSATSSERIGKAMVNTWARLQVHNSTAATSMGIRIIMKTNLDRFCANKAMDAGNFKYPWYRRAGPVPGQLRGDRDSVKKPGIRRLRPPQ